MTHKHIEIEICGELRCGICYEEELLKESIKDMRPPKGEIISVYDETKHRKVMKKK